MPSTNWLSLSIPTPDILTQSGSFPPSPTFLQCHLINPTNEYLVIHLSSPGGTPFALDYYLDSVPSDGACPQSRVSSPTLASPRNATITFSLPGQPPLFVVILSHVSSLFLFLVSVVGQRFVPHRL